MAEEGETERSVVIEPFQTVFGGVSNLADLRTPGGPLTLAHLGADL